MSEEIKRTVGRPASFPANVETKAFLKKLPVDAIAMVRELAERRGQNLDFTLDQMIRRSFREATRSRSKKS
jgi:hypothetical protein